MVIKWILKLVFLLSMSLNLVYADARDILILRHLGVSFTETSRGIQESIDQSLSIKEIIFNDQVNPHQMANILNLESPKILVLIGNEVANEYRDYQKIYTTKKFPVALLVATLKVSEIIHKIKNVVAIKYEIPATTSIVQLRRLTDKRIHRVGIVYRHWMRSIVTEEEHFCNKEFIDLVKIELSDKPNAGELKHKLKYLLRQNLDAVVIASDNKLLEPYHIQNIWKPLLDRFNNPIVSGLKILIGRNVDLATLAIIPDSYALGEQTEQLIAEIIENNWQIEIQNEIYQPISIKKILNKRLAWKKGINLDPKNLSTIDYILE